ncbi:MAG: hypothetical protein KAJ03_08045 [Gammaproteobacteria bacterium]|nr:hypothetical protein [Gammaproteobacteria bacterium]
MSILFTSFDIPIVYIGIALLLFVAVGVYAFGITFLTVSIPNGLTQLKAGLFNRAIVIMHYSTSHMKMYAPRRNGKNGIDNTLQLPPSVGVKFDPSGNGLSEKFGKGNAFHFFSKAPNAFTSTQVKAIKDFTDFCNEKGIPISEDLIDVLVIRNLDIRDVYEKPLYDNIVRRLPLPIRTAQEEWLDEDKLNANGEMLKDRHAELIEIKEEGGLNKKQEKKLDEEIDVCVEDIEFIATKKDELDELSKLKTNVLRLDAEITQLTEEKHADMEDIEIITGYLDPDTKKTIYTLQRLQDDLKKTVIKEGLYVYNQVADFIFAASSNTSAGVAEGINIAKAEALESNRTNDNGFNMMTIGGLVMMGIMLMVGAGITYIMITQ